jgi:hypothetical protein
MGRTDYCDIHSYWCHPTAPGGGSWTNPKMRQFWFVRDLPMVNQEPGKDTVTKLAIKRVLNRPYTVSEYDHPYPMYYAAEGNPMVFAMGAFQDWGAIMHFAWTHSSDYDPQVMTGYFDMKTNTVKQVHFPACYAMFTRGDVTRGPGKYRYTLDLSEPREHELNAAEAQPNRYVPTPVRMRATASLAMAVFAGMNLTDLAQEMPAPLREARNISSWQDLPPSMGSLESKWIRNEFGELYWSFNAAKGGYFTVDTPKTKVFTGFTTGRAIEFGGLTVKPGRTRLGWATISLTKARGAPGNKERLTSGRYLLAATGLMQNTGEVLKQVGPNRISTAKGYGGEGGTAPILCEGIPATLILPGDRAGVRAFALDQNGDHSQEVPVTGSAAQVRVQIGPQYRTVWYELVVE